MALNDTVQATVRMVQLAAIRREPAFVRRDTHTNGWLHRYAEGTLVSPRPRGIAWQEAKRKTVDVFFHQYYPSAGDVVLELGAEYGTETVTLSRIVGDAGRVISVEAHPWTFELLQGTTRENKLKNVDVIHAAVVDHVGPVSISDADVTTLTNSVVSGDQSHEVPGTTVDALVDELGLTRIDLLKVNIEGAEGPAMLGMRNSHGIIRNAVISCHDFRAGSETGSAFRTRSVVETALHAWGFEVTSRPDDPRPWIRDYLYATGVR